MRNVIAVVAIVASVLVGPVRAHETGTRHAEAAAPSDSVDLPMVKGEVVKIDERAGKIQFKHGAIPNLDMEAMSMVFKANDPAMLKTVKVGDKVNFQADKVNGQLTVMKIEKAK